MSGCKRGRSFLRRILNALCHLNRPSHKIKLSSEFHADISWWVRFLNVFNGKCMMPQGGAPFEVFTDACNVGAGINYGPDWGYINFELDLPEVANLHINHKETAAIVMAARRWGPLWRNKTVNVFSDNTCSVHVVNKGSSKNKFIMGFLRELFWLSAIYNFDLKAHYIPGEFNILADSISRLHENKMWGVAEENLFYKQHILLPNSLRFHMSKESINFLIFQILTWLNWKVP